MDYDYDIFISYSRDDPPEPWLKKLFRERFESAFGNQGIDKVRIFDDSKIRGGQNWENVIKEGLAKSKIIVPIFTGYYFNPQRFAIKEMAFMYQRHLEFDSKIGDTFPIIPISLVPKELINEEHCPFQYKDFFEARHLHHCKKEHKLMRTFLENLDEVITDILKNYDNVPKWEEQFSCPDFFKRSEIYVPELCRIFRSKINKPEQ